MLTVGGVPGSGEVYPGPEGTFFCLGRDLPGGWEVRCGVTERWRTPESENLLAGSTWYQVQPARRGGVTRDQLVDAVATALVEGASTDELLVDPRVQAAAAAVWTLLGEVETGG
ncbi:MAG TPA: hypothetical protein VFV36_10310 [Candidatus Methylomirabilis sp.]|nr:hypothetical protein [Candidatus Methylomirabilis sp.]